MDEGMRPNLSAAKSLTSVLGSSLEAAKSSMADIARLYIPIGVEGNLGPTRSWRF
jgi:hypothetical protein